MSSLRLKPVPLTTFGPSLRGLSPAGRMVAGAEHKDAEMHLPFLFTHLGSSGSSAIILADNIRHFAPQNVVIPAEAGIHGRRGSRPSLAFAGMTMRMTSG